MTDSERLAYSVLEAAQLLGLSSRSIYRLIGCDQLKAVRAGRVWRVPREAIEGYLRGSLKETEGIKRSLVRLERLEAVWELLKELRYRGIDLRPQGGRLLMFGEDPSAVSAEIKQDLRRYSSELRDLFLME